MLIILTGPPGAGKSTIAKLLANKYKKSVSFSIDTFRHFIVGGNFAPWDGSPEAKKQHKLTDEIVEGVITKYLKNKYTVILDGIYNDGDINKFRKKFKDARGFILLPSLAITKKRDRSREKHKQVPHRVKPLHDHFSLKKFKNFEIIDTSLITPRATLKKVMSRIV